MPRRGLSINEALKVLAELPSDVESECTDSSDTEEYIPEQIEEIYVPDGDDDAGDDDDDDEEVDDPSQPGPSTQPQIPIWSLKKNLRKTLPDFVSRSGPSDELWELQEKTPITVFQTLFRNELMEHIVFESNLYATQSGKVFSPLTLEELCTFLGINLLMGIKKMPSYRDYWANEEALRDTFISSHMSQRRFAWILGNLHLNNNLLEPKRGEENFDRLYKVRPYLNFLSESFMNGLHSSEYQSIDESMIKFKGRSSIKQYMPKKPIKRGYKVWMRCNESGYASQFEIYSGKKESVEKNLGEHVVKRMTECLYGKNHRVFMDNFFTSYELFRFLETKNIYSCGTVILNRKNLPRNLLAQDKDLKRGEYDWAVSNDGLICLKWKDKRCVSILTSHPDAVDPIKIERKEKDGTRININCPKGISTYNKNMGFVDKFDHLKSLYEVDRKSKKWWHRIFFHFLDVAVINSYILHKLLTNEEINTAKQFRLSLVYSLCAIGKNKTPSSKKRISSSPQDAPHYKVRVSEEKRFSNVEHMPVKGNRRRCAFCSTKQKPHVSRYMCKTCNVGLCFMKAGTTCFEKYHEKIK